MRTDLNLKLRQLLGLIVSDRVRERQRARPAFIIYTTSRVDAISSRVGEWGIAGDDWVDAVCVADARRIGASHLVCRSQPPIIQNVL